MVEDKQIIIEEIKHIAYHFSGVPITDETAEPYAESLLYKLVPTPVKLSDMLPMEIPPNGVMVKSESIEKLKAFIEPSKDAKRIVMDELRKAQRGYGPVLDMVDDRELELIADDLLAKLNIPEIEEVIGEYQATIRKLNEVNGEKVKLQHQLQKLPQQKTLDEKEVRKIIKDVDREGDDDSTNFYTDKIINLVPKQFSEAEIRAICVGVLLPPLGNVPVMHILGQINVLVRNLATLTSKDNIKEYYDE